MSPVSGSIRETEELKLLATQIPSWSTAIPVGPPGTSIVWTTSAVLRSMRETVALPPLVTQTESKPIDDPTK